MKRVLGWWIGRRIDLRDPSSFPRHGRCSWCVTHGFACGGDVHAIIAQVHRDATAAKPTRHVTTAAERSAGMAPVTERPVRPLTAPSTPPPSGGKIR
jgi:hypothetical protein